LPERFGLLLLEVIQPVIALDQILQKPVGVLRANHLGPRIEQLLRRYTGGKFHVFRLPGQYQSIFPATGQTDAVTETDFGFVKTTASGRRFGQFIDLVQPEQLPRQRQQGLAANSRAAGRQIEQGVVGKDLALQATEREDSPVHARSMGGRAGENHLAQFTVGGGSLHDPPDPSGQVGIGHAKLLGVLQSVKQMEECPAVRFRSQLVPEPVSGGRLLRRQIRQPRRFLLRMGLFVRERFVRLDALRGFAEPAGNVVSHFLQIGTRKTEHPLAVTHRLIGPEPFEGLLRQVVVVSQVSAVHQLIVLTVQRLFGDGGDVVATEVQCLQVPRIQRTGRPFGQIVVAQIQILQMLEIADVERIKVVVAQVQSLQMLQTGQRGIQVLAAAEVIAGKLESLQLRHLPDALRQRCECIAIKGQMTQVGERLEKPVAAFGRYPSACQVQAADMPEILGQRWQIAQLQAVEIQNRIAPGNR